MTDDLLDRKEAARLCKISERTLDRQKDIRRIKLTARRIVFRRSDLVTWIESKAHPSTAA